MGTRYLALMALLVGCTSAHVRDSRADKALSPANERSPTSESSPEPPHHESVAHAGEERPPPDAALDERLRPCSEAWFARVEGAYPVSDGDGHGPDRGSREWMHALERQRGLDRRELPELGTDAWCREVDRVLFPHSDRD